VNCRFELISGEWVPDLTRFTLDFIENVEVDLAMEGGVECAMEGVPQAIGRETWTAIIFDCFSHWEISFLDPIY